MVKQALTRAGHPADDRAGYVKGAPLEIALRQTDLSGAPFSLRHCQVDAAEIFHAGGSAAGGSGVIVLPCGAGKTLVGMAVTARLKTHTLILATSTVAVRQWRRELLDKTTLKPEEIGEYTGLSKDIRPVTLATYNILVHRRRREEKFTHFKIFDDLNWGLILGELERMRYAVATDREKFRIASENPDKLDVVRRLMETHAGDRVLVIGQFINQLETLARLLGLPLITGKTPVKERERLFDAFRRGELPRLALSKVGNFSIDPPDANVLIQVSGQFGSRQEEAQRLGRVLRPKKEGGSARFYTVVSRATREEEFASNRQLFLTEQGYAYEIVADGALYEPHCEGYRRFSLC